MAPLTGLDASVSVVICTYNPDIPRLGVVLEALAAQELSLSSFEVIIVDNASTEPVQITNSQLRLRVVRELRQGLTYARLKGVLEAAADVIVFVDDDNVLSKNYLRIVNEKFGDNVRLGAVGGKVRPIWSSPAKVADWMPEFFDLLALRDLGDSPLEAVATVPSSYPQCAPVGAGMAVRRGAIVQWVATIEAGMGPSDRAGGSLSSSGDNDIVLHILRNNYSVAYEPRLCLDHIIPSGRLDEKYMARLAEAIMVSWVQTLDRHGIRPWPRIPRWTLPIRRAKAYLRMRAWESPAAWIRWRRACGQLAAQAELQVGAA